MSDAITGLLLLSASVFLLLAGLAIARMPDLFMRMQAATKAATLGAGCMLMAVAVHFGELTVVTRALLVTAFVLLTAPVAAHMIARAAYSVGTPLWEGTIADENRGQNRLAGQPAKESSNTEAAIPSPVEGSDTG